MMLGFLDQGWQTLRSSWLLLSSHAPFVAFSAMTGFYCSFPCRYWMRLSRCDLLLGGLPYLILLQSVSLIRDLSLVRYSTPHHPQLTPPSGEREGGGQESKAQTLKPEGDPPAMPRLQSHGSVLRTCDTSSKALSTSTSPAGAGRDSSRDRHRHRVKCPRTVWIHGWTSAS